ncbi:MAG: DEAD/DEAH box helicase [Acidimicrobiia bacterium]
MGAGKSDPAVLEGFLPAVSAWFRNVLGTPTPPQALAWPVLTSGEHCLVVAPTGSGKTLTAFLWALDRIWREAAAGRTFAATDVLYVSPLKALNEDVRRNLRVPLEGIRELEPDLFEIGVGVRSGDTTGAERQRMLRRPPTILITTPESLYLLLTTAQGRRSLSGVRTVVVDEVHAICGDKRGVHLALSLERLAALVRAGGNPDPQRIGLSATVAPLTSAASFVGGCDRHVEVVDASVDRSHRLEVRGADYVEAGSVWDEVTAALLDDVGTHTSTLVFVNNRRQAEQLVARLNDAAASRWEAEAADLEPARAHHGSVSKELRRDLEERLKAGELACLVATGTLELGIDMGAIDLVCQVESPKSVARGLQRVGRSGHLVGATSEGHVYPLHRSDLAEAAACAREMDAGAIETTTTPANCLDVLAQQVVAEVVARGDSGVTPDALFGLVRRSSPYRTLTRAAFDGVVGMLAGDTADPDLAGARPRVVWDRSAGRLEARPGARQVAVTSGGTIPDRGLYPVVLAGSNVRLGELDEEFVFESKHGDVFALGTSLWRISEIGRDRIVVTEAPGAAPRMPFWRGEGLGRPRSLGDALGRLLGEIEAGCAAGDEAGALRICTHECHLDDKAASTLVAWVAEQARAAAVPTERRVVVEAFPDEIGDWRIVVHCLRGARVNRALGLVLAARMRDRLGVDLEWTHGDDGVVFRFPELDGEPPRDLLRLVAAGDVEELLLRELAGTALFAGRFRENAARALLLPRNRPGRRTPLWLQRLRAADLLVAAGRDPDHPIVVETYRECLEDALDVAGATEVLRDVRTGALDVVVTETVAPSPFAAGMMWRFVFEYLYDGDTPKAEARSAALGVNRELLTGLLGRSALRDLLEPAAIEEVTARLTRTAEGWRARDTEEVADLLRRFGDLSRDELAARSSVDVDAALTTLGVRVREVQGRWVVTDEAGEYAALLEGRGQVGRWLRRSVLGSGIVTVADLAARYGLDEKVVTGELAVLAAEGVVERGEFAPAGRVGDEEWVGTETLARMHRRSLSLLRARTRPVDGAAYSRFLLRHHGIDDGPRPVGVEGLNAVLVGLEGALLHVDGLESSVLARHVDRYDPAHLDSLVAAGRWRWRAMGGGRVLFVRPEHESLVAALSGVDLPALQGADAELLEFLARGGGWRTDELARATGTEPDAVDASLGRLLWAGHVTNDSLAPLRSRRIAGPEAAPPPSRAARRRTRARLPRGASVSAGRWSAVAGDASGADGPEAAAAVAAILLHRHGIASRDTHASGAWAPGWPAVAAVLASMEVRGDVRRGYFVEGLAGVQYAEAWTVDALRAPVEEDTPRSVLLAAADPAQPWGDPLESHGVRRSAGARVVLEGGAPVLAHEGSRVTPLSDRPPEAFAAALAVLRRDGQVEVEAWGRGPVTASVVAGVFRDAGWRRTPKGFRS